jgi:hypothetical protein
MFLFNLLIAQLITAYGMVYGTAALAMTNIAMENGPCLEDL